MRVASHKQYWIEVRGFEGHMVAARSAGAARYADYRAYVDAGYGRDISFRDFLGRIEAFHHHGPAPSPTLREVDR